MFYIEIEKFHFDFGRYEDLPVILNNIYFKCLETMLYNILYYNESRCYLTQLFGDVLRFGKYTLSKCTSC